MLAEDFFRVGGYFLRSRSENAGTDCPTDPRHHLLDSASSAVQNLSPRLRDGVSLYASAFFPCTGADGESWITDRRFDVPRRCLRTVECHCDHHPEQP